jgi:hypothetical protein
VKDEMDWRRRRSKRHGVTAPNDDRRRFFAEIFISQEWDRAVPGALHMAVMEGILLGIVTVRQPLGVTEQSRNIA